jgi:UDP-N-acetylmuramate--alanine ligase
MIAWILQQAGRAPTVMNGAVMKNFADADHPFASALIGGPDLFVSEVDESDGSIARYDPTVAVVSNISLDHKSMEELRDLFGGFTRRAAKAVLNLDNVETQALAQSLPGDQVITFALGEESATLNAHDLEPLPTGMRFSLTELGGAPLPVVLNVPGAHNVANALAAVGAVRAIGVPLTDAVAALKTFAGIRRRMEVVGTAGGITVIDDFAHNPDKIAATLKTLHAFDGRLLILFQPHGFGPLRLMQHEFIDGFAGLMRADDVLLMPEPVYYGGTTDRSVGSEDIAAGVRDAEALPTREACGDRLIDLARPGDRIIVMGARDDTLSTFATAILDRLICPLTD